MSIYFVISKSSTVWLPTQWKSVCLSNSKASQNGVRFVDVTRYAVQMLFIDTLSAKHFQLKTNPKTEATLSDQSI